MTATHDRTDSSTATPSNPFAGAQRAATEATTAAFGGIVTGWIDALRPFAAASPVASAWLDEWKRAGERAAAWPKVAEIVGKRTPWATPHDVIATEGPTRLIRFRGAEIGSSVRRTVPLLMVFALVNRPYILDLLPHKSVVRQYLRAGFDVWMVDWGVPTAAESTKTLHDYIEGTLHRLVRRVLDVTGQPQLDLFGYCMGGTMTAMYTSLHQELVRNLTLLAAPVDWARGDCLLKTWTQETVFDVDAVVDAFPLVPSGYLGTSFNLLKPVDNNFRKWMGFAEKMTDEKFLEEFVAMEGWVNDNIPISGAVYRDFVKFGLQRSLLAKGEFPLGPHRIDLGRITCPVLNLVAESDHLVPREQSDPVDRLVGSSDTATRSLRAGHIGLAVSGRAHQEFWPSAAAWLLER
ncbi:MAG TPA: alpha/beta fold hydrolase [Phycisphaerales bacterium]|mgnify:CR=1 FL=1|nr:alpha/beta fold hydrolase [Phycisphaerales bacterium]HMP37707.1 alpha/beta fold hydrolase [Phycisphaerales bacterium]